MYLKQLYKDRKNHVKTCMDKKEWTKELDTFLMQSVIRNYFNFETVSKELNQEAHMLNLSHNE
jgi:hypothetical protein